MKTIIITLSTLFALFTAGSAFSAQIVNNDAGKEKIGVVSAGGATMLDELVASLSAQADKKGATYFKVISTSGANKMHGVAEIYK